MPRIFISHSSKDRRFVEADLIPFLRQQGIEPWYSRDDIEAASHWESTILGGLRESEWFIVVLTPNAVSSEWVQTEVSWALAERKGRVIPLVLEACDVDELHLALRRIQWVDLSNQESDGWKVLEALVLKLSGKGSEPPLQREAVSENPLNEPAISGNAKALPKESRRSMEETSALARDLFQAIASGDPDQEADFPERMAILKATRILIIDDEDSLLAILRVILEKRGAVVEIATDGGQGLERIRAGIFDLVLSDIVMQYVDGIEVLLTMRKEDFKTPVIVMSGCLSRSKLADNPILWMPPVAAVLRKPFCAPELLTWVLEVIAPTGLHRILTREGKAFSPLSLSHFVESRSILSRLTRICADSTDLFQTSFRHKAVDMVHEAANRVDVGISIDQVAADLYKSLKALEAIWNRYQQGSDLGLLGIIEAKVQEIPIERPAIKVTSAVDHDIATLKLPRNTETLFVLALLEFVGNALDALSGKGEIRVAFRRLITRKSLFLSVWNSGDLIPSDLTNTLFCEGVTTKGSGRGMGLYIIDQLARRLDGSVKLAQGDGVQFALEMPLCADI